MKEEEVSALLADMIANPEKAGETAEAILDGFKKDVTEKEEEKEEIKKEYEQQSTELENVKKELAAMRARAFLQSVGKKEEQAENPLDIAVRIAGYVINPEKEKER